MGRWGDSASRHGINSNITVKPLHSLLTHQLGCRLYVSLGSIHTIWYSWLWFNGFDRSDCILKWYTVVPTSLATLKASWSPSAGSAQLVASANPAFRQYQPANTDLLDSGYPLSSAYHAFSPQPLDPFFDDEDDMHDSAVVQPIPMQRTESHLPVILRRSFAKCYAWW